MSSRPPEAASAVAFGPLVAADWLDAHLGEPDLIVLDASWYLSAGGRDARAEYLSGHLPGAVYFDLDAASDSDSPWPHMLPPADVFARLAGELGIGAGCRVVVYDGSGTNLSAARAWWMFRVFGHRAVAVLDGGLVKWRAEGRRTEPGMVSRPRAACATRLDRAAVRTRDEVSAALRGDSWQVVDVRPAGRFRGAEPEPRPGIPSGHMSGARNLPYTDLVGPDGTLLAPEALAARMAAAGIDPARPVIATCGSGTSACGLLLALEQLGRTDYALYDGSWTEWAGSGMPVEARA